MNLGPGCEGSICSSLHGLGNDVAFKGLFELGQPSLCTCDAFGLQMQPSKDAASE